MKLRHVALPLAILLALAGCSSGNSGGGSDNKGGDNDYANVEGLTDLIKAAQEEGEFTLYYNPDPKIVEPVVEAFGKEFGIKAESVRLSSGDFMARYQAEAEAKANVADAIILTTAVSGFWEEMVKSNYLTPVKDADIPQFPEGIDKLWLRDDLGTAIVTLNPNGIAFNTDSLTAKEAPKSWKDLADPKWAGQVALTDPRVSNSFLDFFYMIQQKYGDDVVKGIGKNAYRYVPSAIPLGQLVGAGEAQVGAMTNGGAVGSQASSGLPLDINIPDYTNGVEQGLGINANAPNPNAARLFAWYVWYGHGKDMLIETPLTTYISQSDSLPREYTRMEEGVAEPHKAEILALLGID